MTRKHFRAMAAELNTIRPAKIGAAGTVEREAFIQWTHAVEAMVNVGRMFNSRFSADRFREACGWTDANYATARTKVA